MQRNHGTPSLPMGDLFPAFLKANTLGVRFSAFLLKSRVRTGQAWKLCIRKHSHFFVDILLSTYTHNRAAVFLVFFILPDPHFVICKFSQISHPKYFGQIFRPCFSFPRGSRPCCGDPSAVRRPREGRCGGARGGGGGVAV